MFVSFQMIAIASLMLSFVCLTHFHTENATVAAAATTTTLRWAPFKYIAVASIWECYGCDNEQLEKDIINNNKKWDQNCLCIVNSFLSLRFLSFSVRIFISFSGAETKSVDLFLEDGTKRANHLKCWRDRWNRNGRHQPKIGENKVNRENDEGTSLFDQQNRMMFVLDEQSTRTAISNRNANKISKCCFVCASERSCASFEFNNNCWVAHKCHPHIRRRMHFQHTIRVLIWFSPTFNAQRQCFLVNFPLPSNIKIAFLTR